MLKKTHKQTANRKLSTTRQASVKSAARTRPHQARLESLHRLNLIHQAILTAASSQEIAHIVIQHIPELLPYPFAAIILAGERGRAPGVLAANLPENFGLNLALRPFHTNNGARRALPQEIEIVPKIRDANLPAATIERFQAAGIHAQLVLPLRVARKRFGSLYLYAQAPTTPEPVELETAQQVANILALALQQMRLHEIVDTTRARLLALTHRQIELEENQRRQLARELHDMVGQNLTALNINLHFIERQLAPDTLDTVRNRLSDSSQLVEDIVERIRNLMADLRPSILDDLGLPPALRWYAGQFLKRTEIPVYVKTDELETRLPQAIETALFRIAQEALTNVAKHARAQHVEIVLRANPEQVILTIKDDGVGFDFPAMRRDASQRGVGLVDMRERAEAIGGRLWVECKIGQGTLVQVQVPR